jgi:hypothetical protein
MKNSFTKVVAINFKAAQTSEATHVSDMAEKGIDETFKNMSEAYTNLRK